MNEPYVNPWLTLTYSTDPVRPEPKAKIKPPAKPAKPVVQKKPSAYGRQYTGQRLFEQA